MSTLSVHINDSLSDETLMQRIASGNKEAFTCLYHRYARKLCQYADSYLNNNTLSEDIVQEVFIRVFQSPEKFDTDKRFSTWIYTITTNLCKNARRHQQIKTLHAHFNAQQLRQAYQLSQHRLHVNDLKQQLEETFATLNEKQQQLYILRFEQQLSLKEIATILNIPEGSVKSGIFYLLHKYKSLIQFYAHAI